jgi:hypothetical protein
MGRLMWKEMTKGLLDTEHGKVFVKTHKLSS